MTDMTWFVLASTVGAVLAIAIGVILPAYAMGRAISMSQAAAASGSAASTRPRAWDRVGRGSVSVGHSGSVTVRQRR